MYGDIGGMRDWITYGDDPYILLGAPLHGGLRGELLWHPIQGPPGGHPWRSPITHYLQHGGECSDSSLVYDVRGIGDGTRRVWTGGPMSDGILLRQK